MALALLLPGSAAAATGHSSVVGGTTADPAAWPFMAAIVDPGVQDTFLAQFCGGALVSPRAVLTAAHCVVGKRADELAVVFGARLLPGRPRAAVSGVVVHPGYPASHLGAHDLAVLTLAEPSTLPVAPLAGAAEDLDGRPATVAGFGNAEHRYPTRLKQADVVLGGGLCEDATWDARRVICGDSNSDYVASSCDGDSGGPLMADAKLVGIVSYGPESCRGESYFARVSADRGFIDAAVNGTPLPVFAAAAPRLSLAQARAELPGILGARFGRRFSARRAYRVGCYRMTAATVRCRVRWGLGGSRYAGFVDMRNDPANPSDSLLYGLSVTRTPR